MDAKITASRMNLMIYKQRVVSTNKAYSLLKKKLDALKMRFRLIMIKLIDTKKKLGYNASDAYMMLAKSEWGAGDFSTQIRDSIKKARIRLNIVPFNLIGFLLRFYFFLNQFFF